MLAKILSSLGFLVLSVALGIGAILLIALMWKYEDTDKE